MLGSPSVSPDACEIPDSRTGSTGSPAADGSHRRTATRQEAKERKSEAGFNGLMTDVAIWKRH